MEQINRRGDQLSQVWERLNNFRDQAQAEPTTQVEYLQSMQEIYNKMNQVLASFDNFRDNATPVLKCFNRFRDNATQLLQAINSFQEVPDMMATYNCFLCQPSQSSINDDQDRAPPPEEDVAIDAATSRKRNRSHQAHSDSKRMGLL